MSSAPEKSIRIAARIVPLRKREADLREALHQFGGACATLEMAAREQCRLTQARTSLEAAAARVYAAPARRSIAC